VARLAGAPELPRLAGGRRLPRPRTPALAGRRTTLARAAPHTALAGGSTAILAGGSAALAYAALAGGRAALAGLPERRAPERRPPLTLRAAGSSLPARTRVARVVPRSRIRAARPVLRSAGHPVRLALRSTAHSAWLGPRSRPNALGRRPLWSAARRWWALRRPAARSACRERGLADRLAGPRVRAWNVPLLPRALLPAAAQRRAELSLRPRLVVAGRLPRPLGSLASLGSLPPPWPLPLRSFGSLWPLRCLGSLRSLWPLPLRSLGSLWSLSSGFARWWQQWRFRPAGYGGEELSPRRPRRARRRRALWPSR
jgi:hypothetical protein